MRHINGLRTGDSGAVLEVPGQMRVARFGWKDQHASLLSFSADAYLNEQGVTVAIAADGYDHALQDNAGSGDHQDADGLSDIDHFARFMRSTKVPAAGCDLAATVSAQNGAAVFDRIQCDTCHVSSVTTASTDRYQWRGVCGAGIAGE